MNIKTKVFLGLLIAAVTLQVSLPVHAQEIIKRAGSKNVKSLRELQQAFVDLKFGMFIHFNTSTYLEDDDWADPDASPAIFNPAKMDCNQWAKAAKSAKMRFGCITTKHSTGFCIWDTKTTDYSVMSSPIKRDVVKEFADAFRREGLRVCLYYSILDTHHQLRPGQITRQHIDMVKAQLTELLTNYGDIDCLIIDSWEAGWSRISYDEIPFEEIYRLIKKLQPNCLVTDHNAGKYPGEMLFYCDVKNYEQAAGQNISKDSNQLPAISCYTMQQNWFWKKSFPTTPVKDPKILVKDNLELFNKVHCNLLLNVAPNRDGLMDANAIEALKEIGKLRKDEQISIPLPDCEAPIITANVAKHKPANSSWCSNMQLMDFSNDDNFTTSWISNPAVTVPWLEIDLQDYRSFNAVMICDTKQCIKKYRLLYEKDGEWITLVTSSTDNRKIKLHRFDRVRGSKVKIIMDEYTSPPAIAEIGVYDEER
jgi:alpha-L-fucosidase